MRLTSALDTAGKQSRVRVIEDCQPCFDSALTSFSRRAKTKDL